MFAFIMFYPKLPDVETQTVDHATVKMEIFLLDQKTDDDSDRVDGKQ